MTRGRDQLLIRLYIDEDISDRLVELLLFMRGFSCVRQEETDHEQPASIRFP
jgi:hypothetical protein